MQEFPLYQCHKRVRAMKIAHVLFTSVAPDAPVAASLRFEDERFPMVHLNAAFIEKHEPKDGDYLVVYQDGYTSISPAEAFESGYTRVVEKLSKLIPSPILKYFAYAHLPVHLQEASQPIGDLALLMDQLPDCAEKSAGLRKLLEAKDCFVRARIG